jgi:RNA polymerase sigma factor (sigma-70 family)
MRTDSGSDQGILQAFLEEQDAALETVRGWVCGHVGSRWRFRDPEAVVQEIVLELLHLAREGRIRSDSSFRAYVQTVARHTCVDQYRRQRLRTSSETEDGFFDSVPDSRPDPEQAASERERREHARFIFQALDPACRNLLGWSFGDDLPGAEIARRLGITAVNARVRVHRCLEKARSLRRDLLGEPAQVRP